MEAKAYINKMKSIQEVLIDYIDGCEEDFQELSHLLSTCNNIELKSFLYIICSIVCNHHRSHGFFQRIERILLHINSNIKQQFQNKELVKIFSNCKIILLFFLEEKVLTISDLPQTPDSHSYFYPEFEENLTDEQKEKCQSIFNYFDYEYDKDTFIKNRKQGENHSYICSLIREDSVEEFVSYVNQRNLPLSTRIQPSLFETNTFLNEKKCNLVKYAAFFGSMQIFNYLRMNITRLPKYIWYYAIHGNNPEMIHFLEKYEVESKPNKRNKLSKFTIYGEKRKANTEEYLSEAIKCHSNKIAEYITEKINSNDELYMNAMMKDVSDESKKAIFDNILYSVFSSYNFVFFPKDIVKKKYLLFYCLYDYGFLAEFLIFLRGVDINAKYVLIQYFCL